MAWLAAPRLGSGGNEPAQGPAVILDDATRLQQGPLNTSVWHNASVADATGGGGSGGTRGYGFAA